MKVEIFHSPSCPACVAAHAELRTVAQRAIKNLEWHEVNVVEDIDRAVALGVLTLPSVAIDGKLVFTSLPTAAQLREALVAQNKRAA